MPNNAFSDKELVGQVVSGRTDLFGQLVERHIHGAYAIAYARVGNVIHAGDALQEAFLQRSQFCCTFIQNFSGPSTESPLFRAHKVEAASRRFALVSHSSSDSATSSPFL